MTDPHKLRSYWIYRLWDLISATLAWVLFLLLMAQTEWGYWSLSKLTQSCTWLDYSIPLLWLLMYMIFEGERDIYRMSRFRVLLRTFLFSMLGVGLIIIFVVADDFILDYSKYYRYFWYYLLFHFVLTALMRMIQLTRAGRRLKAGVVRFNTLMVGGDHKAVELYKELQTLPKSLGHHFVGFIDINGQISKPLSKYMPKQGHLDDIQQVIRQEGVEEVIIALQESDHAKIQTIMGILTDLDPYILIKVIPDMYDIMLGTVKMSHIYGAVLIEVERRLISPLASLVKRGFDIVSSATALVLLAPLMLYVAIRVRLSSEGPIFYYQERIGRYGQPFHIIKFRSMYTDAEKHGPQLSSDTDGRITPWGRVIRKWRLDELPQFFNVLRGDMSIVGPRPERQYYIDQIMERAPHYRHLLKVRPGITSWGQVKYGYASNVDQMVQRLKYDILYIENFSLGLDFKILFYTLLVLFKGSGK